MEGVVKNREEGKKGKVVMGRSGRGRKKEEMGRGVREGLRSVLVSFLLALERP